MNIRLLLFVAATLVVLNFENTRAATFFYITGTNWNAGATWGGGTAYPGSAGATDVVNFFTNASLNVSALPSGSIATLNIGPNVTVTLTLASGMTLNVTGSIVVNTLMANTGTTTLNLTGPGDVTGTSAISVYPGATLNTASGCAVTANSLSLYSGAAKFTDVLTLSNGGVLTPSSGAGTSTLTTNGTANTVNGITINTGANLTWNGSGTSTVNAASTVHSTTTLTIGAGNTINFTSTVSLNGAATSSGFLVNSGALTFTGASLSAAGGATSLITAVTNNSGGSITLTTSPAAITLGGFMNLSNTGTIYVNAATSITASGSNATITNNANGQINVSGASASVIANANPSTISNSGTMAFTVGGTLSLAQANAAATNLGSMTFDASTLSVNGNPSTFTNTSPGSLGLSNSSTLTLSQQNSAYTGSGSITSGSSNINLAGNPCTFSNNGAIIATSTNFNLSAQNATFNNGGSMQIVVSPIALTGGNDAFNNTGSVQASAASNLSITTNGGSSINNNAGSFIISGSSITLSVASVSLNNAATFSATTCPVSISAQNAKINNTGGTFNYSSSTITGTGGSSVSTNPTINNASGATFNMNASTLNFSSGSFNNINNAGTFNAGGATAALATILNLSADRNFITNSSAFNLGPTSIINLSFATASVTNTAGKFTLLSNSAGSASIGNMTSGASLSGTFNVQRFITGGGSLTYRGYRLLSSPVNLTSTSGGGNISLQYINTDNSAVGAYGATGTVSYLGALTGGPSSSGFSTTGAFKNPTIFLYDEHKTSSTSGFTAGKTPGVTAVNGSNTGGASGVSVTYAGSTATAFNVPVGNGYYLYFVGNDAVASNYTISHIPEDTYITATGDINQSTVPVTIWWSGLTTLSDATGGASGGYNLLGNPYPSTIDLNKLCSDNGYTILKFAELSDVSHQWAYWTITVNATKTAILSSTGSDANYSSEYIESGQGFMALAPGTSQTVKFMEDQKIYNTALLTGSSSPPGLLIAPSHPLQLADNSRSAILTADKNSSLAEKQDPNAFGLIHLVFSKDSVNTDGIALCFSPLWADSFDNDDAIDLDGNSAIYLSSYSSDGVRLAVNRAGDYTAGKRIRLYMKGATDGLYTLSMHDISGIDTSAFNVFLVDDLKKDSLDLVHYGSYVFNLSASDTASTDGRFVLAIEKKALAQYKLVTFAGEKANTGILVNWKTYNEGDFTGFVLQKKDASGAFNALYNRQSNGSSNYSYTDPNPVQGNNVYRLQQNDISGNITYSNTITIVYGTVSTNPESLSVYPNPSRSSITISVNAAPAGGSGYTANIYNSAGTLIGNKSVSSTRWSQDISGYKPGIYMLELKTNEGALIGKSKFVKTD